MLGRIFKKNVYTLKDGSSCEVRRANENEWDEAIELAYKVFLKYESKEYGKSGTESFSDFLTNPMLERMFKCGKYVVYVAFVDEKMVGIGSLRNENHLSLLFVDGEYHRKGVATLLVKALQEYLLKETDCVKMTVNASPYGIPFYTNRGFTVTGPEEVSDGIIFTPMEMYL